MLKFLKKLFSKISVKPQVKTPEVKAGWILLAEKELGNKEIAGSKHNPRIIEYHKATTLKATADEVSWCAAFVNWCLRESGELGTGRADARSFLNWGVRVSEPKLGDVVVFWRGNKNGWQGHVGFFVEENASSIKVLGGNQGDQVCYAWYDKSKLLGYRRLQ